MWRRPDTERRDRWERHLTSEHLRELDQVMASLRGRPLSTLSALPRHRSPPSPALDALTTWVRAALAEGLGFVLLRGLPVDRLAPEDVPLAYLALGLPLGELAPQNLAGDLLTDVRDTGADPERIETRLYTTRAAQDFHTDGADVIGLMCLRAAREGGESRLASSAAIVEEVRRERPELYPVLFQPFPWHYQEPGHPALWFSRPICTVISGSEHGARLHTFFIPWYIRRSQALPDAPRLTDAQQQAIEAIETLAHDPRFHVGMDFTPGDVQFLKNATILHARTAYSDHVDPARRRHLLRMWLSAPDLGGDETLRRGVVREPTP